MFNKELRNLIIELSKLPKEKVDKLVVGSMPFGDILNNETREVYFARPNNCSKWPNWSYRIVVAAKKLARSS